MAITVNYNATSSTMDNISVRTNRPAIEVHGTGGETGAARVMTIAQVVTAAIADGAPTAQIGSAGRTVFFDNLHLRITGNVAVDMSGFDVRFNYTNTAGGMSIHGFNNTAPTNTQGDGNGQAEIITNQCSIAWRNTGTAGRSFNGPFYSFSRWNGQDFSVNVSGNGTAVRSDWCAPGRRFNINTANGTPSSPVNNRASNAEQSLWNISNGIITDGTGYDWGAQGFNYCAYVINLNSVLDNITVNATLLQFAGGGFVGFTSASPISGFNREGTGSAIYPVTVIRDGRSTQSATNWASVARDSPFEFYNYDFGPNWTIEPTDQFQIAFDGSRGSAADVWYRWLYDWNVEFQEGSGVRTRLDGAPFQVFLNTATLDSGVNSTETARITNDQLWADTILNNTGQPAWTPAATLANPNGNALGGQLDITGDNLTNIPIIKYWMNGVQGLGRNAAAAITTFQTTSYDAMLAWYPFDVVNFPAQTINPRVPAASRVAGQTYNNPIPAFTQTVAVHPGITQETLSTVGAYNNLANTGQVFDRAWYEYLNSIIERTTYADKTTAMNNPAALVLNNDGDLVPGNSSITDITIDPVVPHSTTVSQAAVAGATSITLASVPGSIPSSGILYLRRVDGTFNTISYTGRNVTTGVISGIPATGFGSLRAAASVGDVITQPAIDVGTTSITIHAGANFQLNHNIRVTGTITRTGVAVDNNGFSLIDGNAPIVTVSNAPALMPTTVNSTGTGVVVQFFNFSGGTLVSNTPFHTITGNGTFDRSLSAFTSGITGIRAVASHPDFVSRVYDFPTLGTAPVDIDLALMQRATYPSDALSGSNIGYRSTDTGNRVYISAAALDAGNSRLTLSVDGNQLAMSDSQLNDWIHKAVKLRPEFGRLVAILGEDPIGSSGSTGFPISNSDNLRFTPGTTNNSTYNLGHLSNSSTAMGATPATFGVSRQLSIVGGGMSTIGVSFAESASAFDGAAVGVAIDQRGLATRADVESARDVVVGQI